MTNGKSFFGGTHKSRTHEIVGCYPLPPKLASATIATKSQGVSFSQQSKKYTPPEYIRVAGQAIALSLLLEQIHTHSTCINHSIRTNQSTRTHEIVGRHPLPPKLASATSRSMFTVAQ
ncbi:hypothetical protein G9A89_013736 [Geosiphon pyriformis]|nr:hypothetical protein G9A89_013736 [Geosiphon pyriformis]